MKEFFKKTWAGIVLALLLCIAASPAPLYVGTFVGNGGGVTNLNAAGTNDMGNYIPPIEPYVSQNFAPPLWSPNWTFTFDAPRFTPSVRLDANGTPKLSEAGAPNFAWFNFDAPPGVTNIILSGSFLATSANTTIQDFSLRASDNSVNYTNISFAVTTSAWVTTNVSWQTNALMAAYIQAAGGVLVSNLSITFQPTPTNLALAGPYLRYDVARRFLRDDPASFGVPNGDMPGEESSVSFMTAAPYMTLEFTTPMGVGGGSVISIYTNGVLAMNWTQTVALPYNFQDISLSGTPTRVDIINGKSVNWTAPNSLRAVFVPANNYVNFIAEKTKRCLFMYGDSILADANWVKSAEDSMGKTLERIMDMPVYIFASGSATLSSDITQRRDKLLRSLAICQPSDIYVEIGRNDWSGNTFGGTNTFTTAYAALVDTFHSLCPAATIYLQAPLFQVASEGTPPNSLTDYRFAISNVYAARTNWTVLVWGPSIMSTSDLAGDGLHPSELGNIKYANAIANALWTYPTTMYTNSIFIANNGDVAVTNNLNVNGTFGLAATNSVPASTNAPKAYVNISVGGTTYKVGLYQ